MLLRIKELRLQRGMRLKDVAEAVGVSIPTIYRWENQLSRVAVSDLSKLAEVFGVRVHETIANGDTRASSHA